MPTSNPRITITLEPGLHAVLRRMSELTGNSQSAIVSELLVTSMPVFERVIAALEAAATIKDSAREEIKAGLDRAQDRIEEQLGIFYGHLDEGVRPLLEQAEKVKRRAARRTAADARRAPPAAVERRVSTPVPVTRGSGTPGKGKKGGGRGRV